MPIYNLTKHTTLVQDFIVADTFISRMTGLLKRSSLSENEALIITQCNSIHMFFMKFSIDAIFLNKSKSVEGLVRNIRPFQLSPVFFKSYYVIELAVGGIERSKTEYGDKFGW